MKKKELLLLLGEGLSIEEIPNLESIADIEELVEEINLDVKTRKTIMEGLEHLRKESIDHSKSFTEMINSVIKSDKNEY